MKKINKIKKYEKFFGVKKPRNINKAEWLYSLCEMVGTWEDTHRKEFPVK